MLILALICFLYAYNVGWNSIQYADRARAALHWPVAEGHINVIRSRRSYQKFYVYNISGRRYTGDLFELPSLNPLHVFHRYKDGQHILVYFDPADPGRSSVNRILDERQYMVNLIYAAVAVLFGIAAFVATVNDACSSREKLGFR